MIVSIAMSMIVAIDHEHHHYGCDQYCLRLGLWYLLLGLVLVLVPVLGLGLWFDYNICLYVGVEIFEFKTVLRIYV